MKNKPLLLLFQIVLAVMASSLPSCSNQPKLSKTPDTVTPIPGLASKTATSLPTFTKVAPSQTPYITPTLTFTPTFTPFAGFHRVNGPRLIIENYQAKYLSIFTDEGKQSILILPNGGEIHNLNEALSPDGKWLAFYTGTSNAFPYDLVLNILSLQDGSVRKVSNVLAEGFPENMRPIAKDLVRKNSEPGITEDGWLSILQQELSWTIQNVAWSPDSLRLAFPAQIDGPSTDIYIYEMTSSEIRRVVDDLENTSFPDWSPDGKWLAFSSLISGTIYTGTTLSLTRADTGTVHKPHNYKDFWSTADGWLTPNYYLITGHGDGGPSTEIRLLDAESGQIILLWPNVYYDFAFDPIHMQFLISGEPEKPNTVTGVAPIGVYLVQLDGRRWKIMDGEVDNLAYLGWRGAEFAGTRPDKFITIGLNKAITTLSNQGGKIAVSPNQKWLLFSTDHKIDLYTQPGKLVWTTPIERGSTVFWATDSNRIWINGKELYSLTVPEGRFTPVECSANPCPMTFLNAVWIP